MKEVRVSTGIVTLAQFKARAPEILRELVESGHPLIITQRGHGVAVLMAPRTYDAMLDRQRVLADLGDRLADEEAARLRDRLFFKSRARSWRDRLTGYTQEPKPKPPNR